MGRAGGVVDAASGCSGIDAAGGGVGGGFSDAFAVTPSIEGSVRGRIKSDWESACDIENRTTREKIAWESSFYIE